MPISYHQLIGNLNESRDVSSFPMAVLAINAAPSQFSARPKPASVIVGEFIDAVRFLNGVAQGTAMSNKATFDDQRNRVNRVLEASWEKNVAEPFFHSGEYKSRTASEIEAMQYKSINTVTDAARFHKKYSSKESESPVWRAAVAVTREFASLQAVVDQAKTKLVKGRVPDPNAKPKEVNPNQVRATCAWCLANQAILADGRMVHHGYLRPGWMTQTASCQGVRFKCLELSDDGLKARHAVVIKERETYRSAIAAAPSRKKIGMNEIGWGKNTDVITPDQPMWKTALETLVQSLSWRLSMIEKEIDTIGTMLRAWKPKEIQLPKRKGSA